MESLMKLVKLTTYSLMLALVVACGGIETGNVGVRTGSITAEVDMVEVSEGFYTAWLSGVDEFSAREITVEVNDLQPKAGDNLTLSDLDAEVFYKADPTQVAELYVQFSGKSAYDRNAGVWYPAFHLVRSLTREAIYKATSEFNSLDIHRNRDKLASRVREILVSKLDERAAGAFTITGVVIRNAKTDPSIEKAIKLAVTKEKEFEAAQKQVAVNGALAKANIALQRSLTPAILRMGGGATPLVQVK